jgi:uncharacterized protein (DUF1501 family)
MEFTDSFLAGIHAALKGGAMQRRTFLNRLAILSASGWAGRVAAVPGATKPKLLVVFLRGGYDAASLLVPVSSPFYYEARPNLAVPPPTAAANASLPLNSDWALHPVLRETVFPIFQRGQLAFLPFAGTDDTSRSHFETQDTIELGQPLGGSRNFRSGFLNRLVGVLSGGEAIAFTDQLPLILQGDAQVPNAGLKSLGKPALDARQSRLVAGMYQGTPLSAKVAEGFAVRDDVFQSMADEMEAASRGAITAKGFELEARRIGKLMRERYTVGFVDVGGWDTHVGQGGATGTLAGRLDELGRSLAALADGLGETWAHTVVVVMSEFGRTFRENGNRGTDHGHGTVYWIAGGRVRGGRIAGEQVRVERRTLFQDRDYPVLNDYREMLGGIFARLYGLSSGQIDKVFPCVRPKDLGLV